jgi:hypothetical protein
MLNDLCSPALLYLGFSLIQIIIDIIKNMYNTALLKFVVMIIFTLLLNILCNSGLNVVAWILVFVPFIMMTVITSLLLYVFGLSPYNGKLEYSNEILKGKTTTSIYKKDIKDINNTKLNNIAVDPSRMQESSRTINQGDSNISTNHSNDFNLTVQDVMDMSKFNKLPKLPI